MMEVAAAAFFSLLAVPLASPPPPSLRRARHEDLFGLLDGEGVRHRLVVDELPEMLYSERVLLHVESDELVAHVAIRRLADEVRRRLHSCCAA